MTPLSAKCLTIINGRRASAIHETATVDPDHHRQPAGAMCGSPHVQVQAVLGRRDTKRRGIAGKWLLHTVRAVLSGRADVLPRRDGLRRPPAVLTHGRSRERHTFPVSDVASAGSFDRARVNSDLLGGGEGEQRRRRAPEWLSESWLWFRYCPSCTSAFKGSSTDDGPAEIL